MSLDNSIVFWRRKDIEGLERLELTVEPDGITATSTVICLEAGGFRIDHHWRLSPDWRVRSAAVERGSSPGHGRLHLERMGNGWHIDGRPRAAEHYCALAGAPGT